MMSGWDYNNNGASASARTKEEKEIEESKYGVTAMKIDSVVIEELKAEIDTYKAETQTFKQLLEVGNHELVYYRNRVAKLEEELRGDVDPQLDQKQKMIDDVVEEESKSAAAATPQPGNKKKRKKKANKFFTDSDIGVVDLVEAAKYDLSKV